MNCVGYFENNLSVNKKGTSNRPKSSRAQNSEGTNQMQVCRRSRECCCPLPRLSLSLLQIHIAFIILNIKFTHAEEGIKSFSFVRRANIPGLLGILEEYTLK